MSNILKFGAVVLILLSLGACRNTELDDLLSDPSAVAPENAELEFVVNNVFTEFAEFVDEASDETMPYVRMVAMTGGNQYNNQDGPQSFDLIWMKAYEELLPDMDLALSLADEGGQTGISGPVRVLKAYMLFTMVDLFGDIPFSEANKGAENLSPSDDDDAAVYGDALAILEQGIIDLTEPKESLVFDPFYDGDPELWLAAANSLKLRYYVMTRLVDEAGSKAGINSIIEDDNYISSNAGDFQFQYGSNRNTPDSRHPFYTDGYENGGPSWYMSNYMMWLMFGDKDTEDPRLRYYFLRQDCDETDEDQFTLACPTEPYPPHWDAGYPFCTASGDFGDPTAEYGGYWGRDHGDDSGIPPDDLKRTAWGLYPAGGLFDNDQCDQVSNGGTDGNRGAGIHPILLAANVDFLLAEAALTLGTDGEARDYLASGVDKSIEKVLGFSSVDEDFVPTDVQIQAYIDEVLARYDAATDDMGRLDVIMTENLLASHGNGLDVFNGYRRTTLPAGLQPTLEQDSGDFPRLMWYPASHVNRNASASQRFITEQVFWDTNPPGVLK